MEPIDNLIRAIDSFHVKHRGYEFSIYKVLLYLYTLNHWQYACQKPYNALTSNQPWHTRTLKRNIRCERYVREILFC